jgi:hypothetical protein
VKHSSNRIPASVRPRRCLGTLARGGHPYRDNPFEVTARAAERADRLAVEAPSVRRADEAPLGEQWNRR